MYRDVSDLAINYFKLEERILFYQNNIFNNIYFLDENDDYIGYLNATIEKNHGSINSDVFFDTNISLDSIKDFFFYNPDIYRVPVLNKKKLLGEYYNSYSIGQSLSKQIEDKCLSLVPAFTNYLKEWSKDKLMHIIGTEENIALLEKVFNNVSTFTECDLCVDTLYTDDFRNLIFDQEKKFLSLSNILISIFVEKIANYFKENAISFYIAKGVRKSYKEIKNQLSEKEIENSKKSLEKVLLDSEYIKEIYKHDKESLAFIEKHKDDISHVSRIISNGIHNVLLDKIEPGFNITNGRRITIGHPAVVNQTVHIFGPCVVQGLCVVDSKTIPSILQNQINNSNFKNTQVINNGLAYGRDLINDLLYMMSTDYTPGDIVVWLNGYTESELTLFQKNNIEIIDCNSCFVGHHDWFCNIPFHCTSKANQIFSKQIFNRIKEKLSTKKNENNYKCNFIKDLNINLSFDVNCIINSYEMKRYMQFLNKYKKLIPLTNKIGSIIITANPCTKGHLYLIQESLKVVNFLYIFLVEENKDGFDYLDRETMLKVNLKNYSNVCVISGGSVMTSELCFPEYFNRNVKYKKINPSLHLKIFGEKIAPFLNIKYRFFGDEPEDYVTQELNKAAEIELQNYGINTIIIPRLKNEINQPISAKRVRKFYKEKDYAEITKLVSFQTYKILLELNNDLTIENLKLYDTNVKKIKIQG